MPKLRFWVVPITAIFERFISVALVYWVVNIGIESLGRFIERKMAISAPDTVQTDVKGDLR